MVWMRSDHNCGVYIFIYFWSFCFELHINSGYVFYLLLSITCSCLGCKIKMTSIILQQEAKQLTTIAYMPGANSVTRSMTTSSVTSVQCHLI